MKMDAMRQADIVGAGRDKALIYPVVAEIALVGDVLVRVEGDGVVRAGVDAGLASGAQIVIHDDDAVIALADRLLRADIGTGGIIAMPAEIHPKNKHRLAVYQPGAVLCDKYQFDAVGSPIFLFAGHLASFAAPARVMVYVYFKFGHDICLYLVNGHLEKTRIFKEWILILICAYQERSSILSRGYPQQSLPFLFITAYALSDCLLSG